jgi:membrane protease YdiL (CAAX protease family)
MAVELLRRRLLLAGVALAAVVAVGLPAFRPVARSPIGLVLGLLIGLALFVLLAGKPRLPTMRRNHAVRIAYLATGAALEELLWRGLLLAALASWAGRMAALAATTGCFAASHVGPLGRRAVVHLLTGAGFGGAFVVAGLPAAIAAHAAYNALVDLAVQSRRESST